MSTTVPVVPASLAAYAILIVDDDPSIRDIIQTILELEGYETRIARNGEQALEVIQQQQEQQQRLPDLILLDMLMPVMSGMVFLHRLVEDIPIIVITATDNSILQVHDHRIKKFIVKPFDIDDLLRLTQDTLQEMQQKPIC